MLRDGRWSEEDASILVPGDIISIKLGDIIPANSRLLDGDALKVDQVSKLVIVKITSWRGNLICNFKYVNMCITSSLPSLVSHFL